MNFQELITKRQSQRQYSKQPVEKEKLEQCLEAARIAPSACNAQPWKFVVVDKPELLEKISDYAEGLGMNKFVKQAPVVVVMVLEKPNLTSGIGSVLKNKEYTLIDIGVAAEHFCLQATELGLGTCMIGWFAEKRIKKLLNIPKSKRLPLIITLGYPEGDLRPKIRKELKDIVNYNTY